MKVIVSGTRDLPDAPERLERVMAYVRERYGVIPTRIIHGASGNVDWAADAWAKARGIKRVPYPVDKADWTKYGKAAGPIRNGHMADDGDYLVALWDGRSRGTGDMIRQMTERGKDWYVNRTDWVWHVGDSEDTQ
jgi:hypothetical protein